MNSSWESFNQPDSKGVQLSTIKTFLEESRDIQYVWYDFYCLPQNLKQQGVRRSHTEQLLFAWQLRNANLLYLGLRVLVLMDLSYQSRFWVRATPFGRPRYPPQPPMQSLPPRPAVTARLRRHLASPRSAPLTLLARCLYRCPFVDGLPHPFLPRADAVRIVAQPSGSDE
mgnify:CR=1 FL=1